MLAAGVLLIRSPGPERRVDFKIVKRSVEN
jgi:hypothetical protein